MYLLFQICVVFSILILMCELLQYLIYVIIHLALSKENASKATTRAIISIHI